MDIWDWIYPTDRRRQRVVKIVSWLLAGAMAALIVLLPFIERRLYPPFGRMWPWMGGEPPDTGHDLWAGVFLLLLIVFVCFCLIMKHRTERS